MRVFFTILVMLINVSLCASEVDDMFGTGEYEFEFERFSDEKILVAIDRDAEIACDKGVCTLHSVSNNYGGFEVSFNVGEGNPYNNGSGSTTNIYTGEAGNCSQCNNAYWGVSIRYKKAKCVQEINVPKSVYYAINRYMYGLMTESGGTKRGFTPADEAMIMFYTTIMSKASGCSAQ